MVLWCVHYWFPVSVTQTLQAPGTSEAFQSDGDGGWLTTHPRNTTSSLLLFSLFKLLPPLSAKQGMRLESGITDWTLKLLTATVLLSILSTPWKFKFLCVLGIRDLHLTVPRQKSDEQSCLLHCWWLRTAFLTFLRLDWPPQCKEPPGSVPCRVCAACARVTYAQRTSRTGRPGAMGETCSWSVSRLMSMFLSFLTVLTNARPGQGMQNPRPEMWPQLPWLEQKTYQKFGEDTIFFSVCVSWFCTNQGLNLSREGLSPFSVALMLIQVVTMIYTKLLTYSVVMLNKKIHWKCTNKNYNKGQLGSFFSDLSTQRTF